MTNLLIHAIEKNQQHSLSACGVDTTPLDVLSDWDYSKVTCPDCLDRVYTPGGGRLNAELAADLKTVNEVIKAGHQAGVHGCDLTAATALDRVCVALVAFTLASDQDEVQRERADVAEAERDQLRMSVAALTRAGEQYDAIGEYRQLPAAMHDAVSDVILDALPGQGDRHDALHKARMALLALEMKPLDTPAPPAADTPQEKP